MFSSHFYCLIPFDKISKFPCLHIDLNSSLTLLYQAVRLRQLDNGFHINFEIGYKSLLICFFYNLKKKIQIKDMFYAYSKTKIHSLKFKQHCFPKNKNPKSFIEVFARKIHVQFISYT